MQGRKLSRARCVLRVIVSDELSSAQIEVRAGVRQAEVWMVCARRCTERVPWQQACDVQVTVFHGCCREQAVSRPPLMSGVVSDLSACMASATASYFAL